MNKTFFFYSICGDAVLLVEKHNEKKINVVCIEYDDGWDKCNNNNYGKLNLFFLHRLNIDILRNCIRDLKECAHTHTYT